jgi:PBP1b-binding outer membrane lipoprotein LpoB
MIRNLMAAIALMVVLLMSGCASVPMAGKSADAKAKQFVPSQDGTANLYIYRNEIIGSAIKMPVLIDGVEAGDTVAKAYIFKTLPPGSHTIVSKAENDSSLTVDMQAGQNYFVWQEVKMGVLYARSKLHLVTEETGEDGVRECGLIKGNGSAEMALGAARNASVGSTPTSATPASTTPTADATSTVPDTPSQPAVAPSPVLSSTSVASASIATAVASTPAPAAEIKPAAQDSSSQAAGVAPPVQATSVAAVTSQESAATAAIEPLAQSVATGLGCGAVQANGEATFIAPCGTYGVLIDCDGGQCRPMHTVHIKSDE